MWRKTSPQVFVLPYVNQKWEIRFNGEKREAIFILQNENKTYAEIAKLLKISWWSVYYTWKTFRPTSFSSHKNQSGRRRKTTKLINVIISKQDHYLTASEITSEMIESLPMYASCIQRSRIWILRPRELIPIAELSNFVVFWSIANVCVHFIGTAMVS
jgi:hypothetical protein